VVVMEVVMVGGGVREGCSIIRVVNVVNVTSNSFTS
jgi:hypothetical protein